MQLYMATCFYDKDDRYLYYFFLQYFKQRSHSGFSFIPSPLATCYKIYIYSLLLMDSILLSWQKIQTSPEASYFCPTQENTYQKMGAEFSEATHKAFQTEGHIHAAKGINRKC